MKIYFDIGNSYVKLNFLHNQQEHYVSYATKEITSIDAFYQLLPLVIKDIKINNVFIVSVVPEKTNLIVGLSLKYFNVQPIVFGPPLKSGIKLNFESPKNVGADLVSLASFSSTKGDNVILVNLGTATTISHIQNKEYKGVIICPGLLTSYNSLINNASKLHHVNLKNISKSLGNNTEEAISIGVLKGHALMIVGLIKEIDTNAKLIISGGHAEKIKAFLPRFEFVKEATIEGLKNIEKINFK